MPSPKPGTKMTTVTASCTSAATVMPAYARETSAERASVFMSSSLRIEGPPRHDGSCRPCGAPTSTPASGHNAFLGRRPNGLGARPYDRRDQWTGRGQRGEGSVEGVVAEAVIDLDAIARNVALLAERALMEGDQPSSLMAVVKADAFG